MTYARRYSYAAILNIVGEPDDDGELASREPETINKSKQLKPNLNDAQVSDLKKKIESGNWSLDKCLKRWKVNDLADVPLATFQTVMSHQSQEKAIESANS